MVSFTDGPAAGVTLMLRRAPVYLRVTRTTAGVGVWDALDQLCDEPNAGEAITVYRLVRRTGWVHLRPGGRFVSAEYRLHPEQPAAGVLRSTPRWRAWCETQWEADRSKEPEVEVPDDAR